MCARMRRAAWSSMRARSAGSKMRKTGGEEVKQIPFLRSYTVFNVEQIEGLPEHHYLKPEPVIEPPERIAHADAFFAATRADIRHGGAKAYYSGSSDHVQMPCFESFRSPEAYYATLAHELTHNADIRTMPTTVRTSQKYSSPAGRFRHDQSDSRKATDRSLAPSTAGQRQKTA